MQNAVINVPDTSVSRQRTSSLANAEITMASGRALPKSKGGDPDHRQSANEIPL
jgi:hypothetical protein